MSDYYENEDKYLARGIDYDLRACLEENPQEDFGIEDIEKVLAVYEGANDEEDWHWVLLLKNNQFAYLWGGCDYTGWDCQSWAGSTIGNTIEDTFIALRKSNRYSDAHKKELGDVLRKQIFFGKDQTWREKMDQTELGQYPKIEK